MTNIFNLSEHWQNLINQAGDMDAQTLADKLEEMGEVTPDKIADMVAAATTIRTDAEKNELYLEPVLKRIDNMKHTANLLEEHVLHDVEQIGKPRQDNPEFKEIKIEGRPWIQAIYTELTAPGIEIIDERLIDEQFKVPQPPALDINAIAETWVVMQNRYIEARAAFYKARMEEVETGEMTESEALHAIYEFDKGSKPEIDGVAIEQKTGINYR